MDVADTVQPAPNSTDARCAFERCSESMVARVVLALVDQLCADADIDIELLTALDYPLEESMSALYRFGIVAVDVRVTAQRLELDVELKTPVSESEVFVGDAGEAVRSFFEIRPSADTRRVALVGSLG